MEKKEKELLLRDLCCRLPYGIKVESNSYKTEIIGIKGTGIYTRRGIIYPIGVIKPYLRPMSSMTEEEEAELRNILPCGMSFSYTTKGELIIYTDCEGDNDHYFICFVEVQDFLNAHHFDYRGLIEKGLAIAAVGENNPYKMKGE